MRRIKNIENSSRKKYQELLIKAHVLNVSIEHLLTSSPNTTSRQNTLIKKALKRLNKHEEPLAYITGHKHFYESDFFVNKHTLIPRPETEFLVEILMEELSRDKDKLIRILEVGTGSGCIAISLLKETLKTEDRFPKVHILATDISQNAITTAKTNAKAILTSLNPKWSTQIHFKTADIIPPKSNQKFDYIISNPPYITGPEYRKLNKSVKNYEPKQALLGGEDGLEIYKKILKQTQTKRTPKTVYLFETSPSIINQLIKLIKTYNLEPTVINDQYKRKRFIIARTQPTCPPPQDRLKETENFQQKYETI